MKLLSKIRFKVSVNINNIFVNVCTFFKNTFILQARSQKSEGFTPDNVAAVMNDMLNLSWETTSCTVQWLFLYMAANPKIQVKCHSKCLFC